MISRNKSALHVKNTHSFQIQNGGCKLGVYWVPWIIYFSQFSPLRPGYSVDSLVQPLISKKDWIELLLFKKWSQKIAAAAILLGPKKLRVLEMSQREITPRGLSNVRLRIFELLGGMHSNMRLIYGLHSSYQYQVGSYQYGADGFKNLGSNTTTNLGSNTSTIVSSIQSFFFRSVGPAQSLKVHWRSFRWSVMFQKQSQLSKP